MICATLCQFLERGDCCLKVRLELSEETAKQLLQFFESQQTNPGHSTLVQQTLEYLNQGLQELEEQKEAARLGAIGQIASLFAEDRDTGVVGLKKMNSIQLLEQVISIANQGLAFSTDEGISDDVTEK